MTAAAERTLLATAAWAFYKTPARIAAQLRASGPDGLHTALTMLLPEQRAIVQATSDELAKRGVNALFLGDPDYPAGLEQLPAPPPILFYVGNLALLRTSAVGMCGSRGASEIGLKAARACGLAVAKAGLTIVSGYARGVDMATHMAALEAGGSTIIVLAEGISHFHVKRAFGGPIDMDRVLVVSQFPPRETWNVGSAMTRNAVIAGIGRALVVIEAQESGGTLNAGLQALALGRPVMALEFESGPTPDGNSILIGKGARPVRRPGQLADAIALLQDPHISARQMPLALA